MKKQSKRRESKLIQQKILQLEEISSSILEKIKMVRLDVDASEDGNLISLEGKWGFLQRQIFWLKEKLTAINRNETKRKLITYQLFKSKKKETVELVSGGEINPKQNKISSQSYLGLVLTQKKVGEVGEIKIKQKKYKIKILSIEEK